MKTVAVVCDDIIECAGNLDEKFCDGPKDNTVPYSNNCCRNLLYSPQDSLVVPSKAYSFG